VDGAGAAGVAGAVFRDNGCSDVRRSSSPFAGRYSHVDCMMHQTVLLGVPS